MVRESHINTAAWLLGYAVTWLRNFFSTFFQPFFNSRNRNQRNLVTVTVTQTHGERVTHLHSGLVTWLRGYVVTQLFLNFFPTFFSTLVTVTSLTWLRFGLVWSLTGYCNREWTFSFLLKIKIGTCSPREGCEKKSYVHNQETNNNMDKIVVKKWKISWKKLTTIKERCKKG